jgi:hypothetical protein
LFCCMKRLRTLCTKYIQGWKTKKNIMQDQDPEPHLHKKRRIRSISGFESCSVWHSLVDPPHFNTDPDLTYYPDADLDLDSFFFDADAVLDPYPTFHPDSNPDPDPSFQDFFCTNNVDPDLGGP